MLTEERIRSFIHTDVQYAGRRPSELTEDTSLLESGALDSLGIVKLVSFLEQEFGITISDEELVPRHFESIRAISMFIESKRSS
jgi:acyl carrier protein